MKVKLVGRKLYLPKDVIEKAKIPENGECDVTLVGDEVVIRRESRGRPKVSEILKKKPALSPIDRMAAAQEVSDA